MTKQRGKNWKDGSRAVPGSGKVGYLGKLEPEAEPEPLEIDDSVETVERAADAIRRRMDKYVRRKGKK